jgi:exopolysaccharide/PEP-CTERM locus tyrosine autokinase
MGKISDAFDKAGRSRRNDPPPEDSSPPESSPRPAGSATAEETDSSGHTPAAPHGQARNRTTGAAAGRRANAPPPPGIDPNLVAWLQPDSFEAEQFKMLKTNIVFPDKGEPPRLIMVTSAIPGEGKSFFASNLAVSMAMSIDDFVLLIDCDLRKPSIDRIFRLEAGRGLGDHLSNGLPLQQLIVRTWMEKLRILPAGSRQHNPAELLSSIRMADMLHEVKTRYTDRFVILDSPPPHLTAETNVMAKMVDGIVVVVRAGTTPRKLVADLLDQIGREKVIGLALNRFDTQRSRYYGYGQYHEHRKYRERRG